MIHELKEIIQQASVHQKKGLKNVLATVVHLEGSSYRKPGVRMLIAENGNSIGAVSGGCVEKEIIHRATSVFSDGKPKVITYDGRYRLGCEGILYILIEPFFISDRFLSEFLKANSKRESLKMDSYFTKEDEAFGNFGSIVTFENKLQLPFSNLSIKDLNENEIFTQIINPAFKLLIIGGEHDAVKLCKTASQLGWEVHIITSIKDSKKLKNFPGASTVIGENPETVQFKDIHKNCAIVIMNHSYVQDLKYLVKLSEYQPKYIGILGATKRRERLFNELFEFVPEVDEDFLDCIYTPAGLHIGAETPEEIAVSIVAEILSATRNTEVSSLKNITGSIHN